MSSSVYDYEYLETVLIHLDISILRKLWKKITNKQIYNVMRDKNLIACSKWFIIVSQSEIPTEVEKALRATQKPRPKTNPLRLYLRNVFFLLTAA